MASLNDWIRDIFYNKDVFDRKTAKMSPEDLNAYTTRFNHAQDAPLSFKKMDGGGTGIGTTVGLGWDKVKAHPVKSTAIGLLGAGNVAGLLDNSKIFGQLAGAGAGVGIPFAVNAIAKKPIFGVPGKVMFGLGGGALGSLFDVLMAKKEEQEMLNQQYGGNYGGIQ
jgi:hypothetical protein